MSDTTDKANALRAQSTWVCEICNTSNTKSYCKKCLADVSFSKFKFERSKEKSMSKNIRVKELIAKLQELDQEAPIQFEAGCVSFVRVLSVKQLEYIYAFTTAYGVHGTYTHPLVIIKLDKF